MLSKQIPMNRLSRQEAKLAVCVQARSKFAVVKYCTFCDLCVSVCACVHACERERQRETIDGLDIYTYTHIKLNVF